MKKVALISIVALTLTACAGTPLPKEQRTAEFIKTTGASKTANYTGALTYLSRNLGDSNSAIKMRDKGNGTIFAKVNVECNAFRQLGDLNNYYLGSDLNIQSKEGKIRIVFEDMKSLNQYYEPANWSYQQINSSAKIEKAKKCVKPFVDGIVRSINKSNNSNW